MPYDILVEVSGELAPDLRDRLLSLAYRVSRSRDVAIVLRGISRQDVDRTLDPIVATEGTAVPGVRYLEPGEVGPLLQKNGARTCLLVSRDAEWVAGLDGGAPRVRSPEEGIAILEERLIASDAG